MTQTIAGRYRLLQKQGRRAYGEAYAAQDIQLERPVVLETLQGPLLATPEARLPPTAAAGLKEDLEKLAGLQSAYVLNVLELQLAGKPPFMVLEPLEGEPLMTWLSQQKLAGKALEEVLEQLTSNLLEGLEAMHRIGLVHKDIRPGTIQRTPGGDFVLLEPGLVPSPELSQALHPSAKAQMVPFTAPEVLRGEAATPAADLFALGAVLRFVATGKPLHAGAGKAESAAFARQAPPPMKQLLPGLREAWQIFLDELVAPEVGKRIATVAAAKEFQDLMLFEEAAQEAGVTPGVAPGHIAPPPDPEKVSKVRPFLLAGLVLGVVAGGYALMPAGKPPPSLTSEVRVGVRDLAVTWKPEAKPGATPVKGPLTLRIEGREDEALTLTEGVFRARLPWKDVDGKRYTVVDAAGQTLATDALPEGYKELWTKSRVEYLPDGGVRLALEANRELTAKASYALGGKAQSAGDGKPATTHEFLFRPSFKEGISGLRLEVQGPLGQAVTVPDLPAGFPDHTAAFEAGVKKLDGLVPKDVQTALREGIKQATDAAMTIPVPGWDTVLETWNTDPDLLRLQGHGDLFFSAFDELGEDKLYAAYDAMLSLERANTALVALSTQDPLPIRPVYQAYCRAFTPDEELGKTALAPGTGPIMMQYGGAAPSWLNENGKKKWPEKFETPFALKPDFYSDGARIRFTAVVEDVSPLYRMELYLKFRVKDADVERSFWFYPRRNMQDLASGKIEKKTRMAVEIPVRLVPREIGMLTLRCDRLGYWGGHGGTTFEKLLLAKVN